jgi:hypothetical protein
MLVPAAVIVMVAQLAQFLLPIISLQNIIHRRQATLSQLDLMAVMVGLVAVFPYK